MQIKLQPGIYMIQGNATRDAEFAVKGEKNTPITKFGVAVGKNEDGSGIFANCTAFGRLAHYAKAIRKADSVCCIGRVEEREYEGKTYKEFLCDWVNFAGSETTIGHAQAGFTGEASHGFAIVEGDDLPF